MREDDKPKDMIGLRNFQGRSSLSLIDDNHPTTWVRRRRVEVESRNKGGHLTVKPQPTGLDGYFGIGQITGGDIHVFGDVDAYGQFADRGKFITNTGFLFNAATIYSSFDGWGQTQAAERLGLVANKQGIGCPAFKYTAYTTYSGTRYFGMYAFYFTRATFKIGSESTNGVTTLLPARYSGGGMSVGYAGIVMDDDENLRPFIIRDYYGGNIVLDFPPYTENQYPWYLHMHRLAPTLLMTKLDYKRSQYPVTNGGVTIPNRIDNMACPGYEIRFSHDNGTTWVDASSTEFFQEFDDTVLPIPGANSTTTSQDTAENGAFNKAIDYLVLQAAPISGTKALAYGLVPYAVFDSGAGIYRIGGKVKLGIIDAAAGTVMSTLTLYDDADVDKAWYWMGLQAFEPIKGGVLMSRSPGTGSATPWRDHPQPGFTPNGVDIAWQPPLDTPGWQQGFFRALGPNEVGSVSYLGPARGYVLRSTTDHGATWKDRALVAFNGIPPSESNQQPVLTQFNAVSQIRSRNLGSNPYQGVPWVSDSRIAAPVL